MNLVTVGVRPSSSPAQGTSAIARILISASGAELRTSFTLANVLYFTLTATDEQYAYLMHALDRADLVVVSSQSLPFISADSSHRRTA